MEDKDIFQYIYDMEHCKQCENQLEPGDYCKKCELCIDCCNC